MLLVVDGVETAKPPYGLTLFQLAQVPELHFFSYDITFYHYLQYGHSHFDRYLRIGKSQADLSEKVTVLSSFSRLGVAIVRRCERL